MLHIPSGQYDTVLETVQEHMHTPARFRATIDKNEHSHVLQCREASRGGRV